MVGRKPSANSQAFYNVVSTVILSGINFLTIPIFTRVLGAENYGLFSVFNSWLLILACFMGLKTQSGIGTALYEFGDEYPKYKSGILLFGSILSVGFVLIGVVFRDTFSDLLLFSPAVVVVLFMCAFAHYVVEFAKCSYVYEKKARLNLIVSVLLSLSSVGLSLGLVRVFDESELYLSRVMGVAISYTLGAAILWCSIFFKNPAKPKKKYIRYSLILGVPIIFHTLSQNILSQSDRVMLQRFGVGGVDVGLYSFFYTYTHIVLILLDAFNTAWCPFYYDHLHEKAFDRLAVKCRNYMELGVVIVCGFLMLSREVTYFFADEEYWGGINIIPIMVLAVNFTFMYQFPVNYEFFNKKTKIIAFGTFSAGVINIILNALMIPRWGMYGAGVATMLSYGALFLLHYCLVKQIKTMKFHLKLKNFAPGLIAVLCACALFYLLADLWYVRWGIGVLLGAYEVVQIYKRKTIF